MSTRSSTRSPTRIRAGRRTEFDEVRVYEYPGHLREAIENLPTQPGVYVFHGEDGDLPLYIGKSINLRHRVMSHLRTVEEARMLRQTRRISFIQTVGEIGALLLEASMIKTQHPLFNQKLRRSRQLCSLRLVGKQPEVVYSKDVNFATEPGLFGLFGSSRSALEGLRSLADQHKLCYGALGLEKNKAGRACFRAMIDQCAGVCHGQESEESHSSRLLSSLEGLRIACWPYPGAIALVERSASDNQLHVIHNWTYLGSVSEAAQAKALTTQAPGFDADGYKILCKPILGGSAEIVLL
jgi:excinuclease Cho